MVGRCPALGGHNLWHVKALQHSVSVTEVVKGYAFTLLGPDLPADRERLLKILDGLLEALQAEMDSAEVDPGPYPPPIGPRSPGRSRPARVASDQGLNKNCPVRGGKSAEVVGVARQQHAAARLGGYRHYVSVDDAFRSDTRSMEHRSDEPSQVAVCVSAGDRLLVSSQESVDELEAASSSIQLREHEGRDSDVLARPRRSLHGAAHPPFGSRVGACKRHEGFTGESDDQRPPSARS